MLKSIRWSLQLWYGFILLGVLSGFGTLLYYKVSYSRYRDVDAELAGTAHMLVGELRPRRQGPPNDGPPEERDPLLEQFFGPADPPPPRRDRPPDIRNPEPTQNFLPRFTVEGRGDEYYAVWRGNGSVMTASPIAKSLPRPKLDVRPPPPTTFRWRDGLREAIVPGPSELLVLVGRSVAREKAELRQLTITLVGSGAGLMVVGLLGGWIVASRAIRPIRTISNTARDISATHLSRRIDTVGANSELGELAGTLNEMFARLEASFDRQVRFSADASHELRTPLSVIYSNTELALSRDRSAEEYRESLASTFRAAKRMKTLVEGLLVLASADSGKLAIKRQAVDMAAVVEDSLAVVGQLAVDRNVTIHLEIQPAHITGDAMRLTQLVTNLLTNAVVYNKPRGRVTVFLQPSEKDVVLRIVDMGIGVAAEHLPRLFDRFYRTDASRSRESGGTGLGLAICQGIVDAHGGEISVKSEAGVGTEFIVRLPLCL